MKFGLCFIFVSLLSEFAVSAQIVAQSSFWSPWSECSASCGSGIRIRYKVCHLTNECDGFKIIRNSETCFKQFCPSYLSWPRLHFSGTLVADTPTVNNIRCNYDNSFFHEGAAYLKDGWLLKYTRPTRYNSPITNWNPSGTGHLYFYNTTVKSFCYATGYCTNVGGLVQSEITESSHGRLVDLDTDWQTSSQIWGMTLVVPGLFKGEVVPTAAHSVQPRMNAANKLKGYIFPSMSLFKTKLVNVTWMDRYYKTMFKSADSLSFKFVYDMYDQISKEGRVSGVIGLTSPDDPIEDIATRSLADKWHKQIPFFIHQEKRILTVDLSFALTCDVNGKFNLDYGMLDLAVILQVKSFCRLKSYYKRCMVRYGGYKTILYKITRNGTISKHIGKDNLWYNDYAGIIDVDIKHLKPQVVKLLRNSRITVVKTTSDGSVSKQFTENPHGMRIGFASSSVHRMNVGDKATYKLFVSQYGKVNRKLTTSLEIKAGKATIRCPAPQKCNRTLSYPRDALEIVPAVAHPDHYGVATFVVRAVKDPGDARGCQLDGQLYPLKMTASYKVRGQTIEYTTSGPGIGKQHVIQTLTPAVHVYNTVAVPKCPTWNHVKDIFIRYYNLYPVMADNKIIDLHSYDDIKKNARMLRVSILETDISSPRYMPTTRDLSRSKTDLIRNWMDCGMRRKVAEEMAQPKCDLEMISEQTKFVRRLIEKAVLLELKTIPPYFTAWLSLKTDYGRNADVSEILKSVFTEEMIHMTMASNLLNAVGGTVNLTNMVMLPTYPSPIQFGENFELLPELQIPIEGMSLGLAENVFSAIEQPANEIDRELIKEIAKLYKMLPTENDASITPLMKAFLEECDGQNCTTNSTSSTTIWESIFNASSEILKQFDTVKTSTIGSFYSRIAIELISLESCAKTLKQNHSNGTIFTGEHSKQLNYSNWYGENADAMEDLIVTNVHLKEPIFPVTNLKSALEAIIEIVYQGEGGSSCTPFVQKSPIKELSHFYRFQEIVHGAKLIKIEKPASWKAHKCLNYSGNAGCTDLKASNSDYCYLGKSIFFDTSGVWPLVPNPKADMYYHDTKARRLNYEFNKAYTRMLQCLEETFGGWPDKIKTCMTDMHYMTIVGKQLVKTPIGVKGNTRQIELGLYGLNASPSWEFIKPASSQGGLAYHY